MTNRAFENTWAERSSSRGPIVHNAAAVTSSALEISRKNTAWLIAFVYLQDVFWLAAHRMQMSRFESLYRVVPFEWSNVGLFVVIAVIIATVGVVAALVSRPLPRIRVSRWFILGIIATACLMNLLSAAVVGGDARYTSGGLTGIEGVIYGVARALSLAVMIIFVRRKNAGTPSLSRLGLVAFVASFAVTIDGLASALTLVMFIMLIMQRIALRNAMQIVATVVLATGVVWLGFISKFATIPDDLTIEFLVRWVVSRFSIQAEQMYTYISGESIIGSQIGYTELVLRSISNRFDVVFSDPLNLEYPRSVSEALYFDMRGKFLSGSSPGALLGTALQGPLFFAVVPAIYAFIIQQLFYGGRRHITFIQLCAYSFLLKQIHSNFSEYLTIVSPTLLVVFIFIGSCLLTVRTELPMETSKTAV